MRRHLKLAHLGFCPFRGPGVSHNLGGLGRVQDQHEGNHKPNQGRPAQNAIPPMQPPPLPGLWLLLRVSGIYCLRSPRRRQIPFEYDAATPALFSLALQESALRTNLFRHVKLPFSGHERCRKYSHRLISPKSAGIAHSPGITYSVRMPGGAPPGTRQPTLWAGVQARTGELFGHQERLSGIMITKGNEK